MQDILRLGVLGTTRFTGVQCCFIGPVDLVHTFTIKQVKQLFQTHLFLEVSQRATKMVEIVLPLR